MFVSPPDTVRGTRLRPAVVATLGSLALAALKAGAFVVTGSTALLASALDSASDVLVSAMNALIVRAASRPADANHPFGHGKLEHLAGLFQALLMAGSAVFVVIRAFHGLELGRGVDEPWIGAATSVVSILGAFALATYLARAGRRLRSPALVADSRHYSTDYVTNLGVLAAMVSDAVFDFRAADPVISMLIAGTIVKSAVELFLDASHSLMDRELATEDVAAVHAAILDFAPTVRGYHDLMTRQSGPDRFVQCHVEIDATLSFRDAHRVIEQIRTAVEARIPGVHVTLHADPWPEEPEDALTHSPHAPRASLP